MTTFRYVAPSGAPIRAAALLRWLRLWVGRGDQIAGLQAELARLVGVRSCHVVSTGRAGMTVMLRALARLAGPGRSEVAIPGYTCYSVAASIVKAGLVPRVIDVLPATLDFDYAELGATDLSRVVAILATNLYGLPSNLPRLTGIARAGGAFVVDDAAQAFGATMNARPCGTFGDAGLYSFDKGKNVSAIDGGAIVSNEPRVAEAIAAEVAHLAAASPSHTVDGLVKLAAYTMLLRPRLYWIPNALPFLGLGRTVFDVDFPITAPPPALAALGRAVLPELRSLTECRRQNAETLLDLLRGVDRVRTIEPHADSAPAYLRLPVLLPDASTRDAAIAALNRAGIGATASYPSAIADIRELRGMLRSTTATPGARAVAQRILTLPTHSYVTAADRARIVTVLRQVLVADTSLVAGPPPAAIGLPTL